MATNVRVEIVADNPRNDPSKHCMLCMYGIGRYRIEGWITVIKEMFQIDFTLLENVPDVDRKFCLDCKNKMVAYSVFKSQAQNTFSQICALHQTKSRLQGELSHKVPEAVVSFSFPTKSQFSMNQKMKVSSTHRNESMVVISVHINKMGEAVQQVQEIVQSCLGETVSQPFTPKPDTDPRAIDIKIAANDESANHEFTTIQATVDELGYQEKEQVVVNQATYVNNDNSDQTSEVYADGISEEITQEKREANLNMSSAETPPSSIESKNQKKNRRTDTPDDQNISSYLGTPKTGMVPLTPKQVLSILPKSSPAGCKPILPKPPVGSSVTLHIESPLLSPNTNHQEITISDGLIESVSDSNVLEKNTETALSSLNDKNIRDVSNSNVPEKTTKSEVSSSVDMSTENGKSGISIDSSDDKAKREAPNTVSKMRTRGVKLDFCHLNRSPRRSEGPKGMLSGKKGSSQPKSQASVKSDEIKKSLPINLDSSTPENTTPVKRGRGRPPKYVYQKIGSELVVLKKCDDESVRNKRKRSCDNDSLGTDAVSSPPVKRRRGRPRKSDTAKVQNVTTQQQEESGSDKIRVQSYHREKRMRKKDDMSEDEEKNDLEYVDDDNDQDYVPEKDCGEEDESDLLNVKQKRLAKQSKDTFRSTVVKFSDPNKDHSQSVTSDGKTVAGNGLANNIMGMKTIVGDFTLPQPSTSMQTPKTEHVQLSTATVTVTMTNTKYSPEDLAKIRDDKSILQVAPRDVRQSERHHERISDLTKKYGQLYRAQSVMYECLLCSEKTTRLVDIEYHMTRVHTEVLKRNCQEDITDDHKVALVRCVGCKLDFYTNSQLKAHRLKVHGVRTHVSPLEVRQSGETKSKTRHVCDICGKVLGYKLRDLRKHILNVHETTKDFECPTCNKKFGSSWYLREHLVTHSDSYGYICEFCGKGYKREYDLKMHRLLHTGKGFMCNVCGIQCRSRDNLKRHKYNTHKNFETFKCQLCSKTLRESLSILSHACFRGRREELLDMSLDESGRPFYMCKECGVTFDKKCGIVVHMLKEGHMPPRPQKRGKLNAGDEAYRKSYTCPKCEMSFLTMKETSEHIDSDVCKNEPKKVSEAELRQILQECDTSLLEGVALIRCDQPVMSQSVFCMCPRCECLASTVTLLNDHMTMCDGNKDKMADRKVVTTETQEEMVNEAQEGTEASAVHLLSQGGGDNVVVDGPSRFVQVSLGPNAERFVQKKTKQQKRLKQKNLSQKAIRKKNRILAEFSQETIEEQEVTRDEISMTAQEESVVAELSEVLPMTTYLCAVCNSMFTSMEDVQMHMRTAHNATILPVLEDVPGVALQETVALGNAEQMDYTDIVFEEKEFEVVYQ